MRGLIARKQLLLLLLAAVLIFGGYVFWPQRADLSALAASGDVYSVEILRDTWGVPHIFGETDPDAAYGLAYAHAEDDFLTIQQSQIAARGQLAQVYGLDGAPNDYMVQLLRIWDVVETSYESDLSADTRAILEAYAAGLNHYAALHPEDVLLEAAFPITGRDIAAASVHKSPLFFGLELTLARLFAMETREDLAVRPPQAPRGLAFAERRFGSNTFAIGPARTVDGSTYLAVNSHQPWEGPVAWYEAHVHSKSGWDAVGGLFPGSPVIIHGHNRDLGWAFTVNQADLVDVYELKVDPEDSGRYLFDGSWRELESRVTILRVKIVGRLVVPLRREVLWSVYGPVIRNDAGTFAVRYAGAGRIDIWEQLYRMNRAETFEDWLSAVRLMALPTFNIGYADRAGNIYYLFNASLPLRDPGYDWSGILQGDTSDTLWDKYLPFDELPQVFNPPAGFIQNANNTPFQTTLGAANPDPEQYDSTLGIETRMSNRALRALELFGADQALTWDEFVAYKFDATYSSQSDLARYVTTLTSGPVPEDASLAEALSILRAWDLTADADSAGATLGVLLLYDLSREIPGFDVSETVGVELSRAVLLASLERVVDKLNAQFGRLDVPWGEVNRLQRGTVGLPLAGGPDLLHAIYGTPLEDGRLTATSGDSYVLLARWDASGSVWSSSIHQYGSATRDPSSPHFADQALLFARQELKPVWLDESAIRANLERAYRPGQRAGE